ncbi:hypothetical protein FT643_04930 [Ketobacter sp. MCCC 1A13808]|uniref:hypothetical protein n=1 Tax=Ketobacter sp. MCCC 1A13808 TaxID=2602738 RepID=UPI000F2AA79C|nr:hypothetical protein [Ketobacter sp. MCCC 1A13808]MVF11483.1 hypothetical protein [Ketobacter sp. MCCC 1A13808]RLP54568.1 MAG: hypothetical protein D6160_09125 [Ketobacter sp.]
MKTSIRRLHFLAVSALYFLLLFCPPKIYADDDLAYQLDYNLEFLPASGQAAVTITIDKGQLIHNVRFKNLPDRYSDIEADGKLSVSKSEVRWQPADSKSRLSLKVKIAHERDPGEFDAMITKNWAIFRGDDIFPAAKTEFVNGAYSLATLNVTLPSGWTSIETGWPRKKGNTFRIHNPDRKFDRPTGWMIAGALGTRRAKVRKTSIAISAPRGSDMRRMDALTFFNFVWPELKNAFKETPEKLLVVGMDDPMWRGGLSGSNSLFLHSDRPIVSENGTSPLLHELTHMVTRISGTKTDAGNDDWIAEGLAEFYSFELIYRAGGMTDKRRQTIISKLDKWGENIKCLRQKNASGATTARAVVLLDELDKEIRRRSKDKYSIDHVTRELMTKRKVSLGDLEESVEGLIGSKSKTLRSSLLQ